MKWSRDVDCEDKVVFFVAQTLKTVFETSKAEDDGAKGDAAEKLSMTLIVSGASTEREL